VIVVRVPGMRSRRDVRAVSARISDVPGVRTLQADLAAQTVSVSGSAVPTAVTAALAAAGYAADPIDGVPHPSPLRMGGPPVDTTTFFSTDITGLPEATRPEVLELRDGDELELRPGPVAKRLGDSTVRMLGYNCSIPGPTLKVRQGSEVVVHVTNGTEIDTTVHWHGLRLENRFDGVPHETQAPIPPGGEFTYRIQFPDPGLYWYHPHIREDVTQELGLYGSILVEPAEPDYWPPAHRDIVLTLDDLLLEDGVIAPFSHTRTNYAAMGRYGNVMLTGGETAPAFTARRGEVVRLWLTNTANSRVFRVTVPGARMKRVGGDSGRLEHEELVSDVVLAPSERAVVDVLFDRAGEFAREHRTPNRTYGLAAVTVTDDVAEPAPAEQFEVLRTAPELAAEREQLADWLSAAPDKILALVAEMDDPGDAAADGPVTYACPMHPEVISDEPARCPKCGMKLMATTPATGSDIDHAGHDMDHAGHDMGHGAGEEMSATGHAEHAQHHGSATADGIEWEDEMAELNRATTTETMRWKLLDRTAGRDGLPVDWQFTAGQRVKIRLVNEMDSDHPMHHPFHIHGAGRFLVLSRDGVPEPNLVWKDTVLIPTGQTVDILLDVTNPGLWMAHCHIAEHMHSGMMFSFTVDRAATS
jgi:FtsP/CotA-like multicopper oxidase with cupredoxin domain